MPAGETMRCRVFPILAVMSLIFCVLLLWFWWRSTILLDQITLSKDRQYFLTSHVGWVSVGWSSCDKGVLVGYPTGGVGIRSVAPDIYATRLTLRWDNAETEDQPAFGDVLGRYEVMTYGAPLGSRPRVHHVAEIGAPYWLLTLVASAAPSIWVARFNLRRRLERRRGSGLCAQCGYDLRAHAPGQKCPECGLSVPVDLVRKPIT